MKIQLIISYPYTVGSLSELHCFFMSNEVKRVTVGRKPGNTIVIDTADVSGDHAVLTRLDETTSAWEVQDVGSRNGTFVDGQRILRKEVTPHNQITIGETPLAWSQILAATRPKETPNGVKPVAKEVPKVKEPELTVGEKLARVYEDYMDKKSRMEEIQKQEALNARYQSLGIPIAALFGGSVAFMPPQYHFISILGSIISLSLAGWSFTRSKKFSTEKRKINMTKLAEQYEINYRCPHCQTKIHDPFPVLQHIKNCRSCKKPLIP